MKRHLTIILTIFSITWVQVFGELIHVNSLDALNDATSQSGKTIKLKPGKYDLNDLTLDPQNTTSRRITFSGSDNTVDLTDTHINVTVGSVTTAYIWITGNNNTILGGEVEDTYQNGLTEITDFPTYNDDTKNLATGLNGSAVMRIIGNNNIIKETKLTVRGSFPYGYGSYYGINYKENVFGLNKRCGILVLGQENTIDGVEVQQRAFGHGIYMQRKADKTTIKNCLIEGRMRKTSELYEETDSTDFPKRSDYKISREHNRPIPKDEYISLCEDGIRMYSIKGSVTVENCTVKKMRGGIRLYLGGPAIVKNCTAIECEYTNFNLPNKGEISESKGDFTYSPLSDYRLGRSESIAEWTIIPSPFATGSHNIMDIQGHRHHITLNRTDGPIDTKEKRSIVITGNGSTIINKTEYSIVIKADATGNKVLSYGSVDDQGQNNEIHKIDTLKE